MSEFELKKPSFKRLGNFKRQAVSLSQESLIHVESLQPDKVLPLLIQPTVEGLNLATWATNHREFIEDHLLKHGGILFRNFQINGVEEFEQFLRAISNELLDYSYRSTPRSQVSGNIYTSTEYPADQSIPLHNEMSYSLSWPMKIAFYCVQSAEEGGETPICDSRKVFQRLDSELKEQFQRKKVMYVRNYGGGLDLSWQNVFQTDNKLEVERYCQTAGIEFEWKLGDRLKTRQICQAIATHPKTGKTVWFNQAHLFHISSLEPSLQTTLFSSFKEEEFPRNAYYGDGSPIEPTVLNKIREAYQQEMRTFPWKTGDILLLDNMLSAHGRKPFVGARKVLVGMAEPFKSNPL